MFPERSALVVSSLLVLAQFMINCYSDANGPVHFSCSADLNGTGSTFQSNLFKLLPSLSADALNNSGFSIQSFGNAPDKVYGLVMCFNDYSMAKCVQCIQDITSNTTQPCSTSRNATVWYDPCIMTYSNKDFFSVADPFVQFCRRKILFLDDMTQRSLTEVLANLSVTTPYKPEMFSMELVEGTNMSAFMQCTKDLSPQECERCISQAMTNFPNCSVNETAIGMRMVTRNCYIRYESFVLGVSSFPKLLVAPTPPPLLPPPSLALHTSQPPPAFPPPLPGSKSNSPRTIAISVIVVLVVASFVAISVIVAFGLCCWRKKRLLYKDHDDDMMSLQENIETDLQYILNPNAEYQVFKFTTLEIATENFSDMNKLGRGGFGPVYKGILPGGKEIAVKRLSGTSAQGLTEFKNEVEFLAKLKHKNLVQLIGCCVNKKEKLLCYEYLPNGSLDKILFEKDASRNVNIGWKIRCKIIDGITRGLHYLHEESRLKIIHRDLKVGNILLDKDMNPKISDFGLARFFEEGQTHVDTNIIAGTFGYMAPEYVLCGNFSAKSDVYSFGVLLLEIVTGQKNNSFSGSERISNLVDHVLMHWNNDTMSEVKDPMLEEEFDEDIKRCVHIALLCVQENPIDRPNMETVKNMLATSSMIIPSLPSTFLPRWLTYYQRDSMTTGTYGLRSQIESNTTSTLSVGSGAESSRTEKFNIDN